MKLDKYDAPSIKKVINCIANPDLELNLAYIKSTLDRYRIQSYD